MDTEKEFTLSMGRAVWIDDDPIKVQNALDNGFDPNYYDNDGATTLHRVAEAGCAKAMKVFLQNDITRTDLKDHLGQTPLHYVSRCLDCIKSKDICKMLLDSGLDINAESNDVCYPTPLFQCIEHKNIQLAAYLLDNSADIDVVNFNDNTILVSLLICGSRIYSVAELEEMIALLLYYNVDVNYPSAAHALFLALTIGEKHLFLLLADYFTGFAYPNGFEYGPSTSFPLDFPLIKPTFLGEIQDHYNLHAVQNMLCMELDCDMLLEFISKLNLKIPCMYDIILISGLVKDLKFFNYFYDKVRFNDCGDFNWKIPIFFQHNLLEKTDFIIAVEKLLDPDFGTVWHPHKLCECLPIICNELPLHFDDVQKILYCIFQFIDSVCLKSLYHVFCIHKFSAAFELILKLNPKVSLYCCDDVPTLLEDAPYFASICYPAENLRLPEENSDSLSLVYLCRNVIRKNLRYRGNTQYIFSYYNEICKLPIPEYLKNIITLKNLL